MVRGRTYLQLIRLGSRLSVRLDLLFSALSLGWPLGFDYLSEGLVVRLDPAICLAALYAGPVKHLLFDALEYFAERIRCDHNSGGLAWKSFPGHRLTAQSRGPLKFKGKI